jgi:hypothetical protein
LLIYNILNHKEAKLAALAISVPLRLVIILLPGFILMVNETFSGMLKQFEHKLFIIA